MIGGRGDDGDDEHRTSTWRFLIDENLDPDIVEELETRGIEAAYLVDALFEGADDFDDILPHCRETGTILVTNNVRDFNATDLSPEDLAGIVIVHDKTRSASEIATEIQRIVTAYSRRGAFQGFESAEDWTP